MNQRQDDSSVSDLEKAANDARSAIEQSAALRFGLRANRLKRALETLLAVTRSTPPRSEAEFDKVLGTMLDAVMVAADAPMGNVQLYRARDGMLSLRIHRGVSGDYVKFFSEIHSEDLGRGMASTARKPLAVPDVASSSSYSKSARAAMLAVGAKASQSMPLVQDGALLGVVSVHYTTVGLTQRDQAAFAESAPVVTELLRCCRGRGKAWRIWTD